MGSRGGGDFNPYFWEMVPGDLILFPADAPRQVTMNPLKGDVIYLSFDFTPVTVKQADADLAANECAAADTARACHMHTLVLADGTVIKGSQPDMGSVKYSIRSGATNADGGSAQLLTKVEDVVRWATPIGLVQLDSELQTELNEGVAVEAERIANRFGRRGSFAARCAFSDRNLHLRMPLGFLHLFA
jgi:hypothetical protein